MLCRSWHDRPLSKHGRCLLNQTNRFHDTEPAVHKAARRLNTVPTARLQPRAETNREGRTRPRALGDSLFVLDTLLALCLDTAVVQQGVPGSTQGAVFSRRTSGEEGVRDRMTSLRSQSAPHMSRLSRRCDDRASGGGAQLAPALGRCDGPVRFSCAAHQAERELAINKILSRHGRRPAARSSACVPLGGSWSRSGTSKQNDRRSKTSGGGGRGRSTMTTEKEEQGGHK
jgi:hypothetical protein